MDYLDEEADNSAENAILDHEREFRTINKQKQQGSG